MTTAGQPDDPSKKGAAGGAHARPAWHPTRGRGGAHAWHTHGRHGIRAPLPTRPCARSMAAAATQVCDDPEPASHSYMDLSPEGRQLVDLHRSHRHARATGEYDFAQELEEEMKMMRFKYARVLAAWAGARVRGHGYGLTRGYGLTGTGTGAECGSGLDLT